MTPPTATQRADDNRSADSEERDLAAARRALGLARDGLDAVISSLNGTLTGALDIIQSTKGRVIVTGMGKSGHIGNKIAATLASTGTPSYFVHPGEASHGDLGMIVGEDTIIALSNSGGTPELSDIVNYAKRFKIPLIALTAQADSALANHADVALILPPADEACRNGLAPTTSTTMMMALGDALAIAMMERNGISATDQHQFHPGGHLAERALKILSVADLMHKGAALPMVDAATGMTDVLLEMTEKRLGCAAVLNAGKLVGVITDGDLRRHLSDGIMGRAAGDIMSPNPQTIVPGTLASEAVQIMNDREITNLLVADEQQLVGVIHIHDCMRAGVV